MAHLQHMPGDPRLVDQLVYELKSKGIFDQFRKECIADVDTRPAYQNLRQRVETSVSTFLSRQCWQPDLNKNQLREKLRKHILDGNYLEQGVERIVDQVVNPKVASVFIPKVEDLVYNYLGITRKKSFTAETSKEKVDGDDLLPTDLEAVSPGSVKSEGKNEDMDTSDVKSETKMEVDEEKTNENHKGVNKPEMDSMSSDVVIVENDSLDKSTIPLPAEGIKLESIPHPENSPPMIESSHIELEKIELPKHLTEPVLSEIPLPEHVPKGEKDNYFKPINTDDDDESSSDSSLRRNMSPLTPIRNFNNENSCDAQQAFDDSAETKVDIEDKKEPSTFRFTIESKSPEKSPEVIKAENENKDKDTEKTLSYQFTNQVNINSFNTPLYDDSSASNNLQIDYESDANSKIANNDVKMESEQNSEDSKKDKKFDDKKPYVKSSHRSRDSHRHSSSKDRRSDSKHSSSRDSSKHDKKSSSKDESKTKSSSSNNKESSSKDRSDKKDRESSSSRHRSSHKSSSSNKDSKSSHKSSSSSSSRHPSKSDEKKSSSSSSKDKEKERSSDKDKNRDKSSRDSKSSSHRSSRDDRKKSSNSISSSSKRHDEKDKDKKGKKETDDHYSLSGRGNHNRRSTDRDSNDGSSSSKGSHNVPSSKSSSSKKETKNSSSKSENTSTGSDTSPSDKEKIAQELNDASNTVKHQKSAVRVDTHLETPITASTRLPFVPDITMKKPRIASNMEEAKKMIKLRKFLEDEQKRMNQEAALLLEFQANVRPNLSQVYSSIPGPELEFACVSGSSEPKTMIVTNNMEKKPLKTTDNVETEDGDNKNESTKADDTLSVEQQLENIYAATYGKDESYSNNSTDTSHESPGTKTTVVEIQTSLNETYYAEINVQIEENNSTELNEDEGNATDSEILDKMELENILGDHEENKSNLTSENTDMDSNIMKEIKHEYPEEKPLKYFNESEKYNAELERSSFCKFYNSLEKDSDISNKIYLINCDLYEENILRDVSKSFGDFEVVNYLKNGCLKLQSTSRSVIKDVNITKEISLPADVQTDPTESPLFSPVKSESSYDLSSDYDTRLNEMVNQKSRQQIMEIILGNVESPSKMPEINYCNESSIESSVDSSLKRKLELDTTINNNTHVLTPNKMRKISESEQITSTTEEMAIIDTSSKVFITTTARSKFLGKARRVGLPRPRKSNLQNSPSSDKSIENYEQPPATAQTPNGKLPPRAKIQRYDTSDLYKPKLHYLSRRNHVT